ncbi:MAG: M4 family metallopeptidase [Bacteroidia bacterium]|nr:M4 family metallopeptidase [Bacteroidia bacterium]
MKTKFFYLSLICILTSQQVFSQNLLHDSTNTTIYLKTWENDTLGLLWWKTDSMQAGQLFTTYKSFTGLAENDSMHLEKTWNDPFVCLQHSKYQQYHNGLVVEGAEYREHYTSEYVILSNGIIAEDMSLSASPEYSEAEALEIALGYVNADLYAWQDTIETEEDTLYEEDEEPNYVIPYPEGELLYALSGDRQVETSNYSLAWKFEIFSVVPFDVKYVYVNALTGAILKCDPGMRCGDFTHIFYGQKTDLDTKYIGGLRNKHFLHANDATRDIRTKDPEKGKMGNYNYNNLPDDLDDHWDSDDWAATSAHYVVQKAWDMFQNLAGRNGMDGLGKGVRVSADFSTNGPNAFWVPEGSSQFEYITFSRGSRSNPMTYYPATYDVAGHEFAHGVTHYESGLVGVGESGALDESFSDICGFLTERYVDPNNWDWLIGEDFVCPQVRDMQLPSNIAIPNGLGFAHPVYPPDWYLSTDWWTYPSSSDNGGVHLNCSVQNRWFYLLSMGGTQLNKYVAGIGIAKASAITYFSYCNIVGKETKYAEAKAYAIAAARILYGQCSFEENQTCRAWSACNIGNYCEVCPIVPIGWGCEATIMTPNSIEEKEIKTNTIMLYPNPAGDEIFIYLGEFTVGDKTQLSLKVELYDVNGRLVKEIAPKVDDWTIKMDINNLPVGVYSVRVAGQQLNKTLKFIKQ